MNTYLKLCQDVLDSGVFKEDRTNTGTYSIFGYQMRFDLTKGFPLLTTKKVHFKSILAELLWFIKGDTNIKYLVDRNVRIWNEWPYERFKNSKDYKGESLKEFVELIKNNDIFAKDYGNLGPVYGKQWRDFGGFDQLLNAIDDLKNNKDSRRIIISSWNPPELSQMALPPCHLLMQFYHANGKLSLQLYQRSGDVFLGIPFNIASYALLLLMVAQVTGLEAHEFIHTIGDAHIYSNHLEQVKLQLDRVPRKLPKIIINSDIKNIEDFKESDFKLTDYDPYPSIKGKVAV